MRVNTKRVLEAWRGGRMDHREQSIWTDGAAIYSYGTCLVAPLASGNVVLNVTKYSVTTSNKQSAHSQESVECCCVRVAPSR